jgi:hypothetical protein
MTWDASVSCPCNPQGWRLRRMGHRFVNTTLGYARLYDGTIAADYYRAMAQVEKQLDLQLGAEMPTTPGHLLAMVDALQAGTLNDSQREMIQALRTAILNMAK